MARPTEIAFTVSQLGKHIGARVDGVLLGGDLDASVVAQIRLALLRHKVLLFADQHHLDETGWTPASFTVNWKFTRRRVRATFTEGLKLPGSVQREAGWQKDYFRPTAGGAPKTGATP